MTAIKSQNDKMLEGIQHKIAGIQAFIDNYNKEGKKLFVTSSFQSHSLPMLHILSRIDSSIPVYFLNTGFHFAETLLFKDEVAKAFGLNLIDLKSSLSRISQRDGSGRFYYASNPDYCCYLNKILPLEPILIEKDVWIAGVRKSQNSNRANFSFEAPSKHGAIRYHPVLDWTDREIWKYIKTHNLPRHPLDDMGYISIGCEPCTQKFDPEAMGEARDGRWAGMQKQECGLHTELVGK